MDTTSASQDKSSVAAKIDARLGTRKCHFTELSLLLRL